MKLLIPLLLACGIAVADPPKTAVLAIDITPSQKQCPAPTLTKYRLVENKDGESYRVILYFICGYET